MRHIFYKIFIIVVMAFTTACAAINDTEKNQSINPLARAYGDSNDRDPLKLGDTPTIPIIQDTPALFEGDNLVPALPDSPPRVKRLLSSSPNPVIGPRPQDPDNPFDDTLVFENNSFTSDFVTIMGAGGEALTVWALAKGNWIWGYTLIDSISFGDARVWQFLIFPKDFVMIKNAKTNTCLNAYLNGIVHTTCDQTNRSQFWILQPMDNGAVQIKSYGANLCIQSPIDDILGDFHKVFSIYLRECSSGKNFDQQWYITAPTFTTKPLYGRD